MYQFQVFISYSSADRPWAEKLFKSFEEEGIEAWFDQEQLEAGLAWEDKLEEGIKNSQHIVVLWSENARQADWVGRELGLGYFQSAVDSPEPGQEQSSRRMIFLPLEGEPSAYDRLHMIFDLRDEGVYAGGADLVDPNIWQGAVEKVCHAIRSEDLSIPVPLLILTMTQQQLHLLDPTYKPPRVQMTLENYLNSIGIESIDDLTPYYGPKRTSWKPFGSRLGIWAMLRYVRNEINKALPERDIRWEPIKERFWSDDEPEDFENGLRRLQGTSPSVVIVDPIALYDEAVRDRFKDLTEALGNSRVVFITILPLQCWGTHHNVRTQMQLMARPLFRRLYEPTVGKDGTPDFWHCDVNIGDKLDIKRTLLPFLAHHLNAPQATQSEYLRHESGSS